MESAQSQPFSIRQATQADSDLLLAWRKAMFRDLDMGTETQLDTSVREFAYWLQMQLGRKPCRCAAFIGLVGDIPVTCAMAWIYEWFPGVHDLSALRGYILNVYTDSAWRRNGYAGQLVQACCDWLRAAGRSHVGLHASGQGQGVYENLGFHARGGGLEMVMELSTT